MKRPCLIEGVGGIKTFQMIMIISIIIQQTYHEHINISYEFSFVEEAVDQLVTISSRDYKARHASIT